MDTVLLYCEYEFGEFQQIVIGIYVETGYNSATILRPEIRFWPNWPNVNFLNA
jgi:hypothetical protein